MVAAWLQEGAVVHIHVRLFEYLRVVLHGDVHSTYSLGGGPLHEAVKVYGSAGDLTHAGRRLGKAFGLSGAESSFVDTNAVLRDDKGLVRYVLEINESAGTEYQGELAPVKASKRAELGHVCSL